jgi:hypothetical protein
MSVLTEFLDAQTDADLQLSRRALSVSQAAWDGPAISTAAASAEVVWHGSDAHRETGAIALVPLEGELSDLVGNIVRVTRIEGFRRRSVCVFVFDTVDMEGDLSLARRPFMELGLLANESIECLVEVVA